jgi:peptidoglycan/xylan/chitin deacetylase (PgdA/CDA1 family)
LHHASLRQEAFDLVWEVRTAGVWSPADVAGPGRWLCLALHRGQSRAAYAKVCVEGAPRGAAVLRYTALDAGGGERGFKLLRARVLRPDRRSLRARFRPRHAGFGLGELRWLVTSRWVGGPCPETGVRGPCLDRLPDRGRMGRLVVHRPRVVGCVPRGPSLRTNGPRGGRRVALTFDDGPGLDTSAVLRVLRRAGARATFFVVGEMVARRADLVRQALAEGHAVGNHTFHHGAGASSDDLRRASALIRARTGYSPCLFRAVGGMTGGGLVPRARALGMLTIQWDVDPWDWSNPGVGAVYARVVSAVRRGSIVVLHDGPAGRGGTVAALPRIIGTLRKRGYRFVSVPELLGLRPVYG